MSDLAARVSPRVLEAPRRLDAVRRQIGQYFEGRRTEFDVPVDFRLAHGFRRMALGFSRDISAAARERAVNRPSLRCITSWCCSMRLSVKRVFSLLSEAK